MFDSGISLSSVIEQLKDEVDIAYPITNKQYVEWANSLEQLLYSEIIQEQKEWIYEYLEEDNPIELDSINDIHSDEAPVSFEDIYTIYADHVQLTKVNIASAKIFPNVFYKVDNNLGFSLVDTEDVVLRIIYFVRPKLKTVSENDEVGEGNIMLPAQFIDLMKAKLRGEAYKLANEDNLAAKWINDYNVLMETFKAWIANKSSNFGM